uniref:uncharacterized protein LOC120325650 isoform X1 n=1 Tax=Styela clava TaxID=7725 RepID=UPI001939BEBC|nr:uncharacterized protein LOC120325650 isoform X1 [Styela clava]
MKISIVFILINVILSSWCQNEVVFHCSPKSGCQMAQCDPVAVGWDRPGYNIDEHLHDKEFPITCKSKGSANLFNLSTIVSSNILDIGLIRSELKELEGKIDKNVGNVEKKDSENCETCVKKKNQSSEYIDLRDKVVLQSKQITDLMTNYAIRSVAMKQLERRAARQSVVIEELKTDLGKVQEMSNKLMEDNNKMNKAISRIEQKLAEENSPQLQITEPTTTIQTTVKPTSLLEDCKLKIGNICYFAVVNLLQNVSYNEAAETCERRKADVVLFRDEKSYNAVVNYTRNTLGGRTMTSIWTGIHIDPMTHDVAPAESFVKWRPGFPFTGRVFKNRTNVYLDVYSNPNRFQGMVNVHPTWKLFGVICEILV